MSPCTISMAQVTESSSFRTKTMLPHVDGTLAVPLPTATELGDQLFRAAEARANQHGLHFGPGADSDLRAMAQNAADKY